MKKFGERKELGIVRETHGTAPRVVGKEKSQVCPVHGSTWCTKIINLYYFLKNKIINIFHICKSNGHFVEHIISTIIKN